MMAKLRIGIIFGGRSGEHEVSLMSAQSVLKVLTTEAYDVTLIGITQEGRWVTGQHALDALVSKDFSNTSASTLLPVPESGRLYAMQATGSTYSMNALKELDVVFPVLHGTYGEDGALQGLLELAGIPYVGSGVAASALGMDKGLFKDVMRARGLPVLDSVILTRAFIHANLADAVAQAETLASYPLFVKPANLGSSVGISKCRNRMELENGLKTAAVYDRRILVERGLNSPRELEVSVLGNDDPRASVPGEIRPADEFYTYTAKYSDDRTELIIPAPLSEDQNRSLQQLAVEVFKACDCAGMARVDFLLDQETGNFYISEINTIPGFTRVSMYPKLWEASGIRYADLIKTLIDLALERKNEMDQLDRTYQSQSLKGGADA